MLPEPHSTRPLDIRAKDIRFIYSCRELGNYSKLLKRQTIDPVIYSIVSDSPDSWTDQSHNFMTPCGNRLAVYQAEVPKSTHILYASRGPNTKSVLQVQVHHLYLSKHKKTQALKCKELSVKVKSVLTEPRVILI